VESSSAAAAGGDAEMVAEGGDYSMLVSEVWGKDANFAPAAPRSAAFPQARFTPKAKGVPLSWMGEGKRLAAPTEANKEKFWAWRYPNVDYWKYPTTGSQPDIRKIMAWLESRRGLQGPPGRDTPVAPFRGDERGRPIARSSGWWEFRSRLDPTGAKGMAPKSRLSKMQALCSIVFQGKLDESSKDVVGDAAGVQMIKDLPGVYFCPAAHGQTAAPFVEGFKDGSLWRVARVVNRGANGGWQGCTEQAGNAGGAQRPERGVHGRIPGAGRQRPRARPRC
jgi:hypothetical protein